MATSKKMDFSGLMKRFSAAIIRPVLFLAVAGILLAVSVVLRMNGMPSFFVGIGDYGRILMSEYYPECEIVDTTDFETAFTGIDFCFMQIRAGRLKMRRSDGHIALAHGCIGQETCGAGGFAYGMRSIPAVVEIINEVKKYSPDAFILNYSNPAAIVAEATKRLFPGDKHVINICDMPVGIMNQYADELGVPRNAIEARYFGLNHFGWFTAVLNRETGEDYLPRLRYAVHTRARDTRGGNHLADCRAVLVLRGVSYGLIDKLLGICASHDSSLLMREYSARTFSKTMSTREAKRSTSGSAFSAMRTSVSA